MARWGVDVWFVSFGPCFGGDRASAEGAWQLPPLSRRICVDRVDRFVICQCGSDMMITLLGCIEVHKMLHQKKRSLQNASESGIGFRATCTCPTLQLYNCKIWTINNVTEQHLYSRIEL